MSIYRGASLLPLIEHNNELCIVLFGSSNNNIFMDIGGHSEENETVFITASRESTEESLNTFNIMPEQMEEKVTNYVLYKDYVCFLKKFNISFDYIKQIYKYNKDIIYNSKYNIPHYWKETQNISLFSINSLLCGFTKNNYEYACHDIFGSLKIVFRRPIKYLKYAIEKNIIYKENHKWTTNLLSNNVFINSNENNKLVFLNKTKSILI